jgi:RNA polymerase sigma factor (sigma-70 family)
MVRVRMGSFLRSREEVDDAVQDVFVRVVEGVERFEDRGDARFINWLARLVEHELSNHSRRERAKKRGGDAARQIRLFADSASSFDIPADSTGVASRVARQELIERMEARMSELTLGHKEVILLREYAGADWKTVAEAMGRPSPEACQELYRRARMDLLRRMGGAAGSSAGASG